MYRLKIIFHILKNFLFAAVLAVAVLLALDHFGVIKTVKPFWVASGSMEPSVKLGSLVFVRSMPSYRNGEIITFYSDNSQKQTTTHRIVQRSSFLDSQLFYTAGDANETIDNKTLTKDNIIGKVVFSIPYLGFVSEFVKKPYGFILLVIVPTTIIIYEELKLVWLEFKKVFKFVSKFLLSKLYRENKEPKTLEVVEKKQTRLPRSAVILPIVGAVAVFSIASGSWFSDNELSSGNLFSASDDFGGPEIAQVLVIHEILSESNCRVGNDFAQWIEIYNGFDITVDLQDFKITDGTNTIALVNAGNIDVAPGEFALLSHDNSVWQGCYDDNGAITANLGTGDLDLNTGLLELLDSSDVVIDHVQWGGAGDVTASLNQSIERVPIGLDSATGNAWNPDDFIVRELPTPGYGSNLVLNEFVSNPSFGNSEWVEIYNPSGLMIDLTNWTLDELDQTDKSISTLGSILPGSFAVYENSEGWLDNSPTVGSPETVMLKDPSGNIIDQHTYTGSLADDESIGRNIDRGNEWIQTCNSTSKGTTNNGICQL